MNSKRGSILIVVVGMLGLLILLTMSVGRKTNQEFNFIKYSLQKMQARYFAWAGFYYALNNIRKDALDEAGQKFDDMYECGFKLQEDSTPEKLFKNIKIGSGFFDVIASRGPLRYGMVDEDGKLNLNALNSQNYSVFKELLRLAGVNSAEAEKISAAAVDWSDSDIMPVALADNRQASEGPFRIGKKEFAAKNRPFENLYELMFLDAMTPEIYVKIKPWVTVFPRRPSGLKLNLATAPREVLLAFARNYAKQVASTASEDADSLVKKMVEFRAGADRVDATADDREMVEGNMALNISEQTVFRVLLQFNKKVSSFLAFEVNGVEAIGHKQSRIEAVVDRTTLTVVAWRNN